MAVSEGSFLKVLEMNEEGLPEREALPQFLLPRDTEFPSPVDRRQTRLSVTWSEDLNLSLSLRLCPQSTLFFSRLCPPASYRLRYISECLPSAGHLESCWRGKDSDIILAPEQLTTRWKEIFPRPAVDKDDRALGLDETSGRQGLTFKAWLEVDEAKQKEQRGTKNE